MRQSGPSTIIIGVLAFLAVALAGLSFIGLGEEAANSLVFASWFMALVALFMLAVRLPLRGRGSRLSAWISTALVAVGGVAVVILANVAIYRHDVHFDVSREGRNTPPAQFAAVIDNLKVPFALTYFYNSGDDNALIAKDLIDIAARGHPLLVFRAIDIDKEPGLARDAGVHAYNTAVFQAGGRKVVVENTTDVTRLAFAALRALKQRVETVCFVTGHGETFRPTQAHFHYSHVETLKGHDVPGAGDILVAEPADLDRLLLGLTEIGYETRGIAPAAENAIPADCSVVADIGPRTGFTAGEAALFVKYLAGGGRLLLLLDPSFDAGPELQKDLLGAVGLEPEPAMVIDPLNHFRTDPDKVAVPYYPPHPITERIALTVFPQVRPIRIAAPPAGVATSILASSSQDSYRQPADADPAVAKASSGSDDRGAQALAVAVEGVWPGGEPDKHFRLVVAGTSKFATNEYFPYVSDGEFSVAILRWLAADDAMPTVKPQTLQLPEVVLTSRQMRDVFIALELLLPLSTLLCGVFVWWRRR